MRIGTMKTSRRCSSVPNLLGLGIMGIGVLAYLLIAKYEVQVSVRTEKEQEVDKDQDKPAHDMSTMTKVEPQSEISNTLFDCPQCNMPAEVATYVTMWDPDSEIAMTYVVINCLSDHDLITVTQEWFVDHVLSHTQE